jgi:hypothetical protein
MRDKVGSLPFRPLSRIAAMKRIAPIIFAVAVGLPAAHASLPTEATESAPQLTAPIVLVGNKHHCRIGMRYSPYFRRCVLRLPFFTT